MSEEVDLVLSDCKEQMEKSVENFQDEASRIRTGRANPALLDSVQVDYYGAATPLQKLATIGVPEPRLMTVQPFDAGSLADIERAILKADLGFTPNNDGKLIRIPVPELTEERRRELVKQVKKISESHKQSVRGHRRDSIAMLKEMEKAKEVDEDASRRGQKTVQDLTDRHCARIDELSDAKEQEIMTV